MKYLSDESKEFQEDFWRRHNESRATALREVDERMKPSSEKIQELVRAVHIIAYEGYCYTEDKADGEMNALFRTIIHLASKALESDDTTN